jgi:putative solute:sodium symporter small subunit
MDVNHPRAHRRACLKITLGLLGVWFVISFGAGIFLREWLDHTLPPVGGAPFGFWMAQQGSILGFVLILVVYAVLMNRLDRRHGYSEER